MSESSATPWTVALQTPLSKGFSRQEYWRGLPFPSPGDLPDPGVEPVSPALAGGFFTPSHQGSPLSMSVCPNSSSQVSTTDLSRFSCFCLWVLASSGPSSRLGIILLFPCLHSFHLPLGFSKSLSGVLQEVEFRASCSETSQILFSLPLFCLSLFCSIPQGNISDLRLASLYVSPNRTQATGTQRPDSWLFTAFYLLTFLSWGDKYRFWLDSRKEKRNYQEIEEKTKQVNIPKYYPATCSVNFPVVHTIWHSSPPSLLLLPLHTVEYLNVFFPSLSCSLRKLYFSVLINKMGAEGCSRFTGRILLY